MSREILKVENLSMRDVARKLVERLPHPEDRRALLVALTEKGRVVIDAAVTEHVENQHHLVEPLTLEERTVLDELLKKYLTAFETP